MLKQFSVGILLAASLNSHAVEEVCDSNLYICDESDCIAAGGVGSGGGEGCLLPGAFIGEDLASDTVGIAQLLKGDTSAALTDSFETSVGVQEFYRLSPHDQQVVLEKLIKFYKVAKSYPISRH
jgi:hypothetical protein